MGVRRVSIPRHDTKSADRKQRQKQRWFKKLQKWRTGCEGRISVLKRRHGLRRSLYKGPAGVRRWVGLGVIADNVMSPSSLPGARCYRDREEKVNRLLQRMEGYEPTPRTVKHRSQRRRFDKTNVHAGLDETSQRHVDSFVGDPPVVIPTAFGRGGERIYLAVKKQPQRRHRKNGSGQR
jgi:Transposase DDE domain